MARRRLGASSVRFARGGASLALALLTAFAVACADDGNDAVPTADVGDVHTGDEILHDGADDAPDTGDADEDVGDGTEDTGEDTSDADTGDADDASDADADASPSERAWVPPTRRCASGGAIAGGDLRGVMCLGAVELPATTATDGIYTWAPGPTRRVSR